MQTFSEYNAKLFFPSLILTFLNPYSLLAFKLINVIAVLISVIAESLTLLITHKYTNF